MRWRRALCLTMLWAGSLVSAQEWPVIPPIPREERFSLHSDLAVSLQLNSPVLTAGDLPTFTLSLRNTSTEALRVPPDVFVDSNVQLRVFDASGQEIRSPIVCTANRAIVLSSVRGHLQIAPGKTRTFPLSHPCGGLPTLPAGDYELDATYWNYPDAPTSYDVYERGAANTWTGRITTPRVALNVVPLDTETERALIALVDAEGPSDGVATAFLRLGHGGSASATSALIRRFERDPVLKNKVAIATALAASRDPGAAGALLEAIERLPRGDRSSVLVVLKYQGFLPPVRSPAPPQPFFYQPPSARVFGVSGAEPTPTDIPEYVRDLINGEDDETPRHRALRGVSLFGSINDFVRLKSAFATSNEESRWLLREALSQMTFAPDTDEVEARQLVYWDVWWKAHARKTRAQWARETLQRGGLKSRYVIHDRAPSLAAAFLLANEGLSPALVLELAQHRSWLVRLAVADAVAEADQKSGARLFIRELSNQYVGACTAANERLEMLFRNRHRFDCIDPEQRQEAIAFWTEGVNGLAPGFLPLSVAE